MKFAVAVFLFIATTAHAADPQPGAKVELIPPSGVLVGQRVVLAVTLYTPDLFTGTPSFDLPQIPGVIVVPPSGSAMVGSETIDGASFTTQRRELAIYAERPGEVRIPAFGIDFQSNAGFGKPTVDRHVVTQEVTFTATLPPGAEGLGTIIAARNLKVTDVWLPDAKSAKVGDAFTRTLTVTADDASGMAFPPFQLDAVAGLAAYAKPPQVNDRNDRGTVSGERTETVTYVCQTPGEISLPARMLRWYDLDARQMRTASIPGRSIDVATVPATASSKGPATAERRPTRAVVLRLLVAATAALYGIVRLAQYVAARRRAWRTSEAAYFAKFRHACHRNDPHAAFVALLDWLDRFGALTTDEFAARANDPALDTELAELLERVYVRIGLQSQGRWNGRTLIRSVESARRRLTKIVSTASSLPPLNPGGVVRT